MTLGAAPVSQAWSAPGPEFQATLDFSSLRTHTWAPCTMRFSAASPPSAGWCWGMRSSTIPCLCLFICTTLMFAGASPPGAVLSGWCGLRRICMKTNRAQRRVCAFTRTAGREWLFWSPLWLSHRPQCYVTRSLRCSNAGPHARPACPPVRGIDTPNGSRLICSWW